MCHLNFSRLALLFSLLLLTPNTRAAEPAAKASEWTDTFPVDKANLISTGKNPYFNLEPGHFSQFDSKDEKLVITVLDETKMVDGVQTRVVEEREEKDGKLIEVSRNYFACDKTTNNVYYFGEDVDIYKDGKVINHEGSWHSGVDGAKFGLMMPGQPKAGDKFYQELAPKVAMDRCELIAQPSEFKTPAGTFKNCFATKETSPLEESISNKVYAPEVGLVQDGEVLLSKTGKK